MASASWLLCALFPAGFHVLVYADQDQITAEPGQTVVLPCHLTSRNPVLVVEWSRTDLGSDYVLLYRDEQIDPFNQHHSYKNRVALADMKNGDVSLVLKDVRTGDSGAYECRVAQSGINRKKKLINNVRLEVAPPPPPGRFEKLTGDQETQTGETRETGDEDGEDQEMVTPEPAAGSEAEVTKLGGNHVWEEPIAEALQVQPVKQSRNPGNEDGGNTYEKNRMVPGVIASLSCVAVVIVAVTSLTLWKKKRSEPLSI